jgi:uncharacterized membrane protein
MNGSKRHVLGIKYKYYSLSFLICLLLAVLFFSAGQYFVGLCAFVELLHFTWDYVFIVL